MEECEMKKLVVMVLVLSAMSFGLSVQNANFDDDVLADGGWGGNPTGWSGWNDKQNFDASALLVPEAQSGDNVDVINQGGWLTSSAVTDGLDTVLIEANKTYQISVWVGRRGDNCGTYAGIVKAWLSCATIENSGGTLPKIDSEIFDMEGNVAQGGWGYVTFTLNTGAAPTYAGEALLIGFDNIGTRAGNFWEGQVILDSVSITPEPATMLLLGLGGLLLRKRS